MDKTNTTNCNLELKMNYADIVSLTLGYADRQDTEVTSRIDLFMRVTEARINRLLMTLDMSCRATTPMSSTTEYYSLISFHRNAVVLS